MMLDVLAQREGDLFYALGEGWLAAGAASFEVTDAQGTICYRAPARNGDGPVTTSGVSSIQEGQSPLTMKLPGTEGTLIVRGISAVPWASAQLSSQAQLLGRLLKRERELDEMTNELMGTTDQLVALLNLNDTTRRHLEFDQVIPSIITEGLRLCHAQKGCVVMELNGEIRSFWLPSPSHFAALEEQLLNAAISTEQPVVARGPDELREVLPQAEAAFADFAHSLLVVPTRIAGKVKAVLALFNKTQEEEADIGFTAREIRLAAALADQAGILIESLMLHQQAIKQERLQHEIEIAQRMQVTLLPGTLPAIPGLEVAAECRPANEVGGDFYDFISLRNGQWAFTLGDVTSKGIPAALFMVVVRTIIRSATPRLPATDRVLQRVADDMTDDLAAAGMFITLLLGRYAPKTQRLFLTNAGHAPVLLYRQESQTVTLIEADGPPIGVLPELLSQEMEIAVSPGDILVAGTDGFHEAVNRQGEMFGIARLMQVIQNNAHRPATDLKRALFDEVHLWNADLAQADDQTVVILKVTG